MTHATKNIASLGVKTDVEKLINTFTERLTVRYEVFSEIWREMKMSKICAGRQTEREAKEFMEVLFDIVSAYWLPPFPFQTRVCALYMLYGLYVSQPCNPRVKIRLMLPQWLEILDFMKTIEEQQHLDVSFVFFRLRAMKALYFVATKYENYPELNETEADIDEAMEIPTEFTESALKEVAGDSTLEQLDAIHNQYFSVKCTLAGPGAAQPERSLNILNDNLALNIKNVVNRFEQKRKNMFMRGSRGGASGGESSESEQELRSGISESVGSKRKRLRDKAYGKAGKLSKSHRHLGPSTVTSSESDSPKKQRGKGRRKAGAGRQKTSSDQISDTGAMFGLEGTVTFTSTEGNAASTAMLDMPTIAAEEPAKARSKKSSKSRVEKSTKVTDSPEKAKTPTRKKNPAKSKSTKLTVKISPPKGKKPAAKRKLDNPLCSESFSDSKKKGKTAKKI